MPETKTAIIADLHLGYSWAQRRRGELGPLADTQSRDKLLELRDELQPARFIFLGDLVHASRPCAPEREWIEALLRELAASAELIAVRGNHDRAFAEEFGHLPTKTVSVWSEPPVTAIHGDNFDVAIPKTGTLLVGHLHPTLPVCDASGAGRKLPVFLANRSCILLPAFSPFAGGYNVACGLPPEFQNLFHGEEIQATVVTGRRAASLGSLAQVLDHLLPAEPGSAKRFRSGKARRAAASSD